jgi:hypothetical protein
MDILSVQSTTLPSVFGLNIAALTKTLCKNDKLYKFVFFPLISRHSETERIGAMEPISFRELMVEMLANTWYPHTYFKLSFGLQDLITTKLDLLKLDIGEPI